MKNLPQIFIMLTVAFLISRGALITDSFVLSCGFVAQRVFSDRKNIYLLLPAIGGVATKFFRGLEPWDYMASMLICAIVFIAFGKEKLKLWQVAVVTGSIVIICVSVYSLVFGEVYKTSPERLLVEGGLAAASVYIFDDIFSVKRNKTHIKRNRERELRSLTFVGIALIHGASLDFALWMAIVFFALWALNTWDFKTALSLIVAASIGAALVGEAQWGIMATIMIATFASGYVKGKGIIVTALTFAITCWCLGQVESGVVLGIDTYGLIISVLAFLVTYWRFGTKKMLRVDVAVTQKSAAEFGGAVEGNSDNGDSFGWEEIGKNKIALVISDGMGKGTKAATESSLVTKNVLKFLKEGLDIEASLDMINSIMMMKSENDSYATVDVVIIDKATGKAKFYKVGAAPSLLKKRGRVEIIEMATVPLGIVNGIKTCHIETTLRKGDMVIMMSDGVSDKGIESVIKTTRNIGSEENGRRRLTATNLCEKIIEKTTTLYRGKEGDDCTVVVARIY